ncbi:MAG: formylglycine-generating enzyme family protein [Mariprofundaceae bacterium]
MSHPIKCLTLMLFATLFVSTGAIAADSPKQGDTLNEPLMNMSFVYIEPGKFIMGSPEHEVDRYNDEQQHEIEIKKGFWMGQYEVTFNQYDAFIKATRRAKARDLSNWGRGSRPVIYVKWFYANEFAKWLSKNTGHTYRLPTEAEWEYAARAGTTTAFSFGDHIGGMNNHSFFKKLLDSGKANTDAQKALMDEYAWYGENAGQQTHPVGKKKPNPWGLYDMHGNVWEWTCSVYHESYNGSEQVCVEDDATTTKVRRKVADKVGARSNKKRSVRGGAWSFYGKGMRSADRRFFSPVMRLPYVGFRLVRED